ncbi:hypothetical protein LZ009_01525 [Ramlibacter sp. XY19]|uniref:hypothetical protein n=1 Tax=Ramlibacter paludis TaxID=2908000 RepID=UPI0023DBA895|nr:hypothetical protein [Ramlibacter paludis]MCG2591459.1 hypothetical protein [Ramlibacter paludis]
MKRVFVLLALAPTLGFAQLPLSQSRLQDDCLQRLRMLVPREVRVQGVDFSALGNYAQYYVVHYRFAGPLENGKRSAACTYRRDGQWVSDDAAAYRLARELEPARKR